MDILRKGAIEMGKEIDFDQGKAPETSNSNKEKYDWNVNRKMKLTGCVCEHHRPVEGCEVSICAARCLCRTE